MNKALVLLTSLLLVTTNQAATANEQILDIQETKVKSSQVESNRGAAIANRDGHIGRASADFY
jgi:hypothetical protein